MILIVCLYLIMVVGLVLGVLNIYNGDISKVNLFKTGVLILSVSLLGLIGVVC